MAIANYTDLVAAGANFTGRADLTSRWPEFIALVEATLNRELRTVYQETKSAAYSITGEYTALPTDFVQLKTIYVNGPPRVNLVYKDDALMTVTYPSATGTPAEYCVQGLNLRVSPTPSGATSSTLVYAAKVPALTSGAPTNWVITNFPDVYMTGICWYAWMYAMQGDKAEFWKKQFTESLDRLKFASDKQAVRNPDQDYRDNPPQRA